jgi:hexokinase
MRKNLEIGAIVEELGFESEVDIDSILRIKNSFVDAAKKGICETSVDNSSRSQQIVKTGYNPIKVEDYKNVASGTQIIACSFGGTNWVCALYEKTQDNCIKTFKEVDKFIPVPTRQCTFEDFVCKMADMILDLASELRIDAIDTVSISLGFPHQIVKTEYGLDAHFYRGKQPKSWQITNFEDFESPPLIGKLLIQMLNQRYGSGQFKHIYILNDTNAVSHFIGPENRVTATKLPVGFVFGTGSNASFGDINLEAGKFTVPKEFVKNDDLKQILLEYDLIHSSKDFIEYYTGGIYIIYQIFALLKLLEDKNLITMGIAKWFLGNKNKALVSEIVLGKFFFEDFVREFEEVGILANQSEFEILNDICLRVLHKASAMICVIILGCFELCDYRGGVACVPVEGAVFWNGATVFETVCKVLKTVYTKNEIIFEKASGSVGIAQFGMVENLLFGG